MDDYTIYTKLYSLPFFVGDEIKINGLIIRKSIISFATILLLLISLVMGAYANYKNRWFMAFVILFPLLIIRFEVGVIVLATLMYFSHGSIFNKKYNVYLAGLLIIFGILISNASVVVSILVLVLLYQWFKSDTTKIFTALFPLGLLFFIYIIKDQTHIIQLFYKEIRLIPFILYNVLMSYKRYICKTETINVEMLRGVNHDFKIPLSVLKLNIDMLLSDLFKIEAKKNSLLNSSQEAIRTLENMLVSINAFLSNKNYVSKIYSTSMLNCIEKTKNIFDNRDAKVELFINNDSKDTLLPIDPIWLERLIFNLLDNAYKHTDDYGTITLTYKKYKNHMTLIVEDTGVGMTKEVLKKVTTPFYRGDKSRSVSGLGLGLSIVDEIVSQLKGELIIRSELGEGTVVTVKI